MRHLSWLQASRWSTCHESKTDRRCLRLPVVQMEGYPIHSALRRAGSLPFTLVPERSNEMMTYRRWGWNSRRGVTPDIRSGHRRRDRWNSKASECIWCGGGCSRRLAPACASTPHTNSGGSHHAWDGGGSGLRSAKERRVRLRCTPRGGGNGRSC